MNEICDLLHKRLNKLPRYSFPFAKSDIFENGIYIMFEKGEKAHSVDRIVRIGSHTGKDNLFSRLNDHFYKENKDRSILRKNIGRCILNKEKNPYLKVWDIDFTTKKSKEMNGNLINEELQKEIEDKVTKYLRENFSFVIIEVPDKDQRMYFESKLISTVSNCPICKPSETWLGNFSTKTKIRESGLYLVNKLYKESFNKKGIEKFLNTYVKNKNI